MGQQDRLGRDFYHPYALNGIYPPEEGQYQEQQQPMKREGAPLTIHQALREYCRIPGEQYFVVSFNSKDPVPTIFSSPHNWSQEEVNTFFNAAKFTDCCRHSSTSTTSPVYDERIPFRRKGYDGDVQEGHDFNKPRKRFRTGGGRASSSFADEEIPSPIVTKKTPICVSDVDHLRKFYEQRFKNCQQSACKLIAKARIKAVEPKKQSTHPYTGKDEKAPDWWPQPWGPGKEEKVRHKEPDHLLKKERLHLLYHILNMIVQPNNEQHKDIRKLQLNIAKLHEITNEALSAWFTDSTNPGNRQKKPYLDEIFKVATAEERYRAGEIDPTTKVHVKSEERIAEGYASDTEDSPPSRTEEDQQYNAISRSDTPARGTMQHMIPYANSQPGMENQENHMQNAAYVNTVPMRESHYVPQVMGTDLHTDTSHYDSVPGMAVAAPLHPQPDFNTQATSTAYSSWATTTAPSASSNPPMYSMHGQPPPLQGHFGQANPPMAQPSPYIGLPYSDGLPSRGPDLNSPNLFRGGSNQGPMHNPTYSAYNYQPARGLPGSGLKEENLPRNMPWCEHPDSRKDDALK